MSDQKPSNRDVGNGIAFLIGFSSLAIGTSIKFDIATAMIVNGAIVCAMAVHDVLRGGTTD